MVEAVEAIVSLWLQEARARWWGYPVGTDTLMSPDEESGELYVFVRFWHDVIPDADLHPNFLGIATCRRLSEEIFSCRWQRLDEVIDNIELFRWLISGRRQWPMDDEFTLE